MPQAPPQRDGDRRRYRGSGRYGLQYGPRYARCVLEDFKFIQELENGVLEPLEPGVLDF